MVLRLPGTGTVADVEVKYPLEVQPSAPPLGGKYKVRCVSPSGIVSYTNPIAWNERADRIANYISTQCVGLYDKVQTFAGIRSNWMNGMTFRIRFYGLGQAPGKFEIVSDDVTPLEGNNITFYNETVISHG